MPGHVFPSVSLKGERAKLMAHPRDIPRSAWKLTGRLGVLLGVLTFIALPAPHAAGSVQPCSYGNAQSLLNAGPVAYRLNNALHIPGFGGLTAKCQFRLYADGETVTFSDQDYILGGIFLFYTYEELEEFGLTRAEAIADLKLYVDRVEIASVVGGNVGTFEDVPLIVTSYRDALAPPGHVVYNHRAFITRLPAGEYLVRYTETYPGFPDFVSTVRVVITAS